MSARSEASRKMAVSYCLQYLGPMREKIAELLEAEKARIAVLTQDQVKGDVVQELNDHIALRKALERFGLIEKELKEELSVEDSDDE